MQHWYIQETNICMSNYLTNIASRSSQSDNISVTPSYAAVGDIVPQISGIELFDGTEGPTESAKPRASAMPKEQVQENSDIFLTNYPQQQPSLLFHDSD